MRFILLSLFLSLTFISINSVKLCVDDVTLCLHLCNGQCATYIQFDGYCCQGASNYEVCHPDDNICSILCEDGCNNVYDEVIEEIEADPFDPMNQMAAGQEDAFDIFCCQNAKYSRCFHEKSECTNNCQDTCVFEGGDLSEYCCRTLLTYSVNGDGNTGTGGVQIPIPLPR